MKKRTPLTIVVLLLLATNVFAQNKDRAYRLTIRPLLKTYCFSCHAGKVTEADIDLSQFSTVADLRKQPKVWIRVRGMLDSGQMPPKDAKQLPAKDRLTLRKWVRSFLLAEARAHAGDPGPVVLRRLSNAEYTYTIRDLTGLRSLEPTKQFPVDGAAGEGFTNTGSALVMSPALLQKYLAAAKKIANHAVLLPRGIRFSSSTTRRDETDLLLERIRRFYRRYTTSSGASSVNLQGIKFATNQGGRLPIDKYLAVTLAERAALGQGKYALVARKHNLNVRYLGALWGALTAPTNPFATDLSRRWQRTKLSDVAVLAKHVTDWQKALWKFNTIGHIGRRGAPTSWLESRTPIAHNRSFLHKLPTPRPGASEVVVHLVTRRVYDNNRGVVVWKNPRLVGGGKPPLNLRFLPGLTQQITAIRNRMLAHTTRYLTAAAEADPKSDLRALAKKHGIDADIFPEWLEYLGIGVPGRVSVTGHFTKQMKKSNGRAAINGWGTVQTPSIVTNAGKQTLRIPGIALPGSVMVHPSPTLFAAVGWRSPISGPVRVTADIADAHPECGNGVEFFLQSRTTNRTSNIWKGEVTQGAKAKLAAKQVTVRRGQLLSFIVGPRHRTHACDLTRINFRIQELSGKKRTWDLAKDVAANVLTANPHSDQYGDAVWHFYKGPMAKLNGKAGPQKPQVPAGSLLAKWIVAKDPAIRANLAKRVQALAVGRPPKTGTPDRLLYDGLRRLIDAVNITTLLKNGKTDPRFGVHPAGDRVGPNDLVVNAPKTVAFRIPVSLLQGRSLQVEATLDPQRGREGCVQVAVGAADQRISPADPVLVSKGSRMAERTQKWLTEFGNLFPAAVCYARIVPVDEVVTLTLFYREDHHLRRLMLTKQETAKLERLWDELYYVSHEPVRLVVALEQIIQFATQDRQDLVKPFQDMGKRVKARAAEFRKRLVATEPHHVAAVLKFASRAWRRPLKPAEEDRLETLYQTLRKSGVAHDKSIRLLIARVLTSPTFLYRIEASLPNKKTHNVRDLELASRLSYFLWSSTPDETLRKLAQQGKLSNSTEILRQTKRMLHDKKTRRLAIQFACQWLHIRDFDQTVEKNERRYPQFVSLRRDMYEESIQFFTDLFRSDRSVLSMLNADHVYLNERLAKHYGIAGVKGPRFRRLKGARSHGRGGILGMATVLSSQSGASRTSPILRGNWVFETLLGEKLPKPPAKVPTLPESVPSGLTARQLIEKHSSVPACAKCHAKIDGYGFSLEQYDTIGRLRAKPVNTKTRLPDGKTIAGLKGLRTYLLTDRQDDILRQFCRKLLGFALGREVQLSDEPLIDEMIAKLKAQGYRVSVAINAIVTSRQFRQIRGR